MNKRLIITLSIFLITILIFIFFANPFPKKEKEKTFKEILPMINTIDIIINSPYDSEGYIKSKEITNKEDIKRITDLLKDSFITKDTDIGRYYEDNQFYYTLILKDKDRKYSQSVYFQKDKISINGKIATIDIENINQIDNFITENITGYGTLRCEKKSASDTLIEKYYYKDGVIYHYSESRTYTPDDIEKIKSFISKINNYAGVSAIGNTIAQTNYSYIIDVDLKNISGSHFKEITAKDKLELSKKTKEDIINDNKDKVCTYTFLER